VVCVFPYQAGFNREQHIAHRFAYPYFSEIWESVMAEADERLLWWLQFRPFPPPGDPGPEVFRFLAELPVEKQGPIIKVISAVRGEVEAVRAKGYAQIGEAIAEAGSVSKR